MKYTDAIQKVRCRCRSLVQGIPRQGRQFILPVFMTIIGGVVCWLVIPAGTDPAVISSNDQKAAPVKDVITVGNGQQISRAMVNDPFLPAGKKSGPADKTKTVIAKKHTAEQLKLTGIIADKDNSQAIIVRGKESLVIACGESHSGITLLTVDEDAGMVTVDDGNAERALYLGR